MSYEKWRAFVALHRGSNAACDFCLETRIGSGPYSLEVRPVVRAQALPQTFGEWAWERMRELSSKHATIDGRMVVRYPEDIGGGYRRIERIARRFVNEELLESQREEARLRRIIDERTSVDADEIMRSIIGRYDNDDLSPGYKTGISELLRTAAFLKLALDPDDIQARVATSTVLSLLATIGILRTTRQLPTEKFGPAADASAGELDRWMRLSKLAKEFIPPDAPALVLVPTASSSPGTCVYCQMVRCVCAEIAELPPEEH